MYSNRGINYTIKGFPKIRSGNNSSAKTSTETNLHIDSYFEPQWDETSISTNTSTQSDFINLSRDAWVANQPSQRPQSQELMRSNGECLRIEIKNITIKPSGFTMDTYVDIKLVLILFIEEHILCICFNEQKDKLYIHLDAIHTIKYSGYMELEIFVKEPFRRTYFDGNKMVERDSTNVLFDGATSISFTPAKYINIKALERMGNEFKKYLSIKFLIQHQLCVMIDLGVEKYEIAMPLHISFTEAKKWIERVSQLPLEGSGLFYRDINGKDMTLMDNYDWKIAKRELYKHDKREIYIGFGI
ncbi:hypothetical protein G9A89_001624 [Geosiphon pyriformis]|nr:hypothetical protein G9A89_001624 [Geosiphon pyriformis]